ncbi:MAG: Gfo/Idh/MocA family oxidoreductase [Planctomycetales bacterium]|nr:Gfo/Idh/MocA family oxidoreductase [Planctomycetales bacterium]
MKLNYKAAVIGTGFIGPVHVEGLRRAGVEVVGILGSSPEKSRAAAESLGLATAYSTIEQLLAHSAIDCVHIASPNRLHFEQAKLCLAAGKHVLCEKPLAMNATESRQLVALAAKSGVATGVNYNIRYYPLCIEAAERRKAGELGDIRHVTGSYAQDWLFHPTDFNWRVLASEGGPLRAVADIGTHWLDLIHAITGLEVQSLCADLKTVFEQRSRPLGPTETFSGKLNSDADAAVTQPVAIDTEDFGAIMLRFQGGARGVFWVSQVAAGRKNCLRWELSGSKQSLSWDSESPNQLWVGHRDSANQILTRDPAMMHRRAAALSSYPAGHNEGFSDSFKQLFCDFYRSIQDGSFRQSPSYPTFHDGHREIMLCEAILESAEKRAWIDV